MFWDVGDVDCVLEDRGHANAVCNAISTDDLVHSIQCSLRLMIALDICQTWGAKARHSVVAGSLFKAMDSCFCSVYLLLLRILAQPFGSFAGVHIVKIQIESGRSGGRQCLEPEGFKSGALALSSGFLVSDKGWKLYGACDRCV